MARIVLGIGTSHTPLLAIPPELWPEYALGDRRNPELCYPPNGWVLSYEEALDYVPSEVRDKTGGPADFERQAAACQRALDTLQSTLLECAPDITVIISDDQDEWFYEDNMPALAIYWGETVPLVPRTPAPGSRSGPLTDFIVRGYGDRPLDVPVASAFGRHVIEYLMDQDFDVAHMRYTRGGYGGSVARRYPTRDGESDHVRETPPHEQGLPHGFAFVVKRLFANQPRPILPVIQNTCYPPNQPSPRRSFALGQALAAAIAAWPEDARVCVIGSGGLSHFVVDEELDRMILAGLQSNDAATLQRVPRSHLYSAASESLNWIALGGALQESSLQMELVDYVPVYRTPAGTGGGWAFARWR